MRRRFLDLCLLAYPRARRERDGDYLRDLALDLSETHGFRRQALSLLRGGLGARIEVGRRSGWAGLSVWLKRAVVACSALAALAFTASSLIGTAAGEGERVEVERFTCAYADQRPSTPNRVRLSGPSRCAEARSIVAARIRGGWDCETRRDARDDQLVIAWRCSLEEELGAGRAL